MITEQNTRFDIDVESVFRQNFSENLLVPYKPE